MRFVVSFVTRRPNGRITRRTSVLEREHLDLGRSTASDVLLPDLRVGLSHARISVQADRVRVEAIGERPIGARGGQTTSLARRRNEPVEVRVGPYAVTIEAADAAETKVSLELVDPLPDAMEHARKRDVFSLHASMPSQRKLSWLFSLIILGVFLVWPVHYAVERTGEKPWLVIGDALKTGVERLRTVIADAPVPVEGWGDRVRALDVSQDTVDATRRQLEELAGQQLDLLAGRLSDIPVPNETLGLARDQVVDAARRMEVWFGGVNIPPEASNAVSTAVRQIAIVLDGFARAPDRSWDTGAISNVHSTMAGNCAVCHRKPFEAVSDQICLDCHKGLRDHARPADLKASAPPRSSLGEGIALVRAQVGLAEERCGSCHREHNGRQGLVLAEQGMCVDCHEGLSGRLTKTALKDAGDFGWNHPQFRPTVHVRAGSPETARRSLDERPQEESGLKFSHAQHLDPNGGVAKMARDLGAKGMYGAPLYCGNCHTPDAAKALFEPIRMDRHCAACHDLTFEIEDGYARKLPHGLPKEVEEVLQDHFVVQEVEQLSRAELPEPVRRRPGERGTVLTQDERLNLLKRVGDAAAKAMDRAFSPDPPRGLCYGCHEVTRVAMSEKVEHNVPPVRLVERYYPHGRFDHGKHTVAPLSCGSCHEAQASKSAKDVLLPPIGVAGDLGNCGPDGICSCRSCHAGETAVLATASPCLMCHSYHGGSAAPAMTPARHPLTSGSQAVQRTE